MSGCQTVRQQDFSTFCQHIKAKTKWPRFRRQHFKRIFLNWNVWIAIKISLKFVAKHPINNISALVLIMAWCHYSDVIMSTIASLITSLTIVYSTVCSDADQRKHQSSTLAFVWGIHRGPVNSPHKWPVTRKMFPFDDVIMWTGNKPLSKPRVA